MDDKKVARINELYHKSKSEGLTPEELKEQQILRKEYIDSLKRNLRWAVEQHFYKGKRRKYYEFRVRNLETKRKLDIRSSVSEKRWIHF